MSSKLLEDSLKLLSLPVFTRTTLTPVLRVPCPHASKAAKSRDGTAARGSSLGKAPLDSRPKEKSPSMNAPCIPSPVLYGHTACPRHFALKEKDIISIRWCSSLGLGRGAVDSTIFPVPHFCLLNSSFPDSSASGQRSLLLGFYSSVVVLWLEALHLEEESHLAHQLLTHTGQMTKHWRKTLESPGLKSGARDHISFP